MFHLYILPFRVWVPFCFTYIFWEKVPNVYFQKYSQEYTFSSEESQVPSIHFYRISPNIKLFPTMQMKSSYMLSQFSVTFEESIDEVIVRGTEAEEASDFKLNEEKSRG